MNPGKDRLHAVLAERGYLDLPEVSGLDLVSEINELRIKKNAVILAHYYQDPAIQDIADFVGDSLGLSRQASATDASIIVFAGVHFMAETAKILNPGKKVLLPDLNSGCSLADSCSAERLQQFRGQHPECVVISYINCSAEVKALSDLICTSANAEAIIASVPEEKRILFAPDRHFGKYLNRKTGRDMILWDGACVVHEAFSIEKLIRLHLEHPSARIVAHPESEDAVLKVAHYIGSTSGMIDFVKNDPHQEFIVATEAGILHQMKREVPGKVLIPAPVTEDTPCACSECGFMRLNTMKKLYLTLRYELPEILVPEDIARRALIPVQRMLELSKN